MSDLKPCPFCGDPDPVLVRAGSPRHSCQVECGNCGAFHESADEGELSGASWNRRPTQGSTPVESADSPASGRSLLTDERAKFEEWGKKTQTIEQGWWFRQLPDGGYSSGNADAAWKAWQARAAMKAEKG